MTGVGLLHEILRLAPRRVLGRLLEFPTFFNFGLPDTPLTCCLLDYCGLLSVRFADHAFPDLAYISQTLPRQIQTARRKPNDARRV